MADFFVPAEASDAAETSSQAAIAGTALMMSSGSMMALREALAPALDADGDTDQSRPNTI
jgi:hypothetical protein